MIINPHEYSKFLAQDKPKVQPKKRMTKKQKDDAAYLEKEELIARALNTPEGKELLRRAMNYEPYKST